MSAARAVTSEAARSRARRLVARDSARRIREQALARGDVEGAYRCGVCGEVGHNARTCCELPEDRAEALAEAARLMAAAEACWRRGGLEGRVTFRAKTTTEASK